MATTGADSGDENIAAVRHVTAVFEKFDRDVYECQELLCRASNEWLLSSDEPAAKRAAAAADVANSELPPGFISSFSTESQSRVILLFPADDASFSAGVLDMHEVHPTSLIAPPTTRYRFFTHSDAFSRFAYT